MSHETFVWIKELLCKYIIVCMCFVNTITRNNSFYNCTEKIWNQSENYKANI